MYPFRKFSGCRKPFAKKANFAKRARFAGKVAKRASWGNSTSSIVKELKITRIYYNII